MFENRDIFRYEVMGKERFADPMAAYRRMAAAMGSSDLGKLFETALTEDTPRTIADEAWQQVVVIARKTFSLPPLDEETGQGVPESQAFQALATFVGWLNEKKGSVENSPTSPLPSEPESSPPSSDAA